MKLNWKSQGVGGSKPKNHPRGGMDIFWNHTMWNQARAAKKIDILKGQLHGSAHVQAVTWPIQFHCQ